MNRSAGVLTENDPTVLGTAPEDTELASLVDAFGVAVVRGTAGTGKSATLARLADAADRAGADVVVVRCDDDDARPVAVLADLAGRLLDRSIVSAGRSPAQHVRALEVLAGVARGDGVVNLRCAIELSIDAIAGAPHPLLVGIDDVHLAPPLSRAVVRELVERLGSSGSAAATTTTCVVTERIEPGTLPSAGFGRGVAPEMVLAPWDAARVARHLRRHLCDGLGVRVVDDAWIDERAHRIARAGGGLPEFVAALCGRTVDMWRAAS